MYVCIYCQMLLLRLAFNQVCCASHFCSHKAKGQQAWDAALHSLLSCSLLHMNFSVPSTYYYLNVCHLFLGNYCWFFFKKGGILNVAALWINALDLQIFLLFLFISQQLLRPHFYALYSLPQLLNLFFTLLMLLHLRPWNYFEYEIHQKHRQGHVLKHIWMSSFSKKKKKAAVNLHAGQLLVASGGRTL